MPKSCGGLTHHGRARAEVQKLGDEGVHVKTHDLGCFQQKRLKAAEGGELYYTVRAGQGLQQQGKQLKGHREGRHGHVCDKSAFLPPYHALAGDTALVPPSEALTAGLTVGNSGKSTGLGSLLST